MKQREQADGFTIIELLVVIVVIGILATIAIVSYSGVRDRAKTERAGANTMSVQKVAEAYYSRHNEYPSTAEQFTSTHTSFPAGVILMRAGQSFAPEGSLTPIDPNERENTIMYKFVRTNIAGVDYITGACVYHWDFTTDSRSEPLYMGNARSTNCHHSSSLGASLPAGP